MNQNEWAQKKAEQIRKQRSGGEADKKVRKEVADLKRSHMPLMWTETRQSLRRRMDLINNSLGEQILEWAGMDINKVVVRAVGEFDQLLSVSYHPEILEIRCEFLNEVETYRPKVTTTKEVVFRGQDGGEGSAEDLAEHIYDKFVASL